MISIFASGNAGSISARVTAGSAACAHTLAAAARKMTFGANHDTSTAVVGVKQEEEKTLGQLRDRVGLASARAAVHGPRARFVHIKVEDTTSGDDTGRKGGGGGGEEATGGEGRGGGEGEGEGEEEEEEEEQQRAQRTQAPSASFKGRMATGADAVASRPRRARLPPGSYADTAVELDSVDDYDEDEEEWGEEEEEEEDEEEQAEQCDQHAHLPGARHAKGGSKAVRLRIPSKVARSAPGSPRARLQAPKRFEEEWEEEDGIASILAKRGGRGHADSSRFKGVSWNKTNNRWKATCEGKHLGNHTTEEVAACECSKYLKDGVVPEPAAPGYAGFSEFKGVSWSKSKRKWMAACKPTHLGYHATEEDAARACSQYLTDGIDLVKHREADTSQFTGVSWHRPRGKWRVICQQKHLGVFTTEDSAARAYNVEAERRGLTLNIIPPVGEAGAGPGKGGSAGPKGDAATTPGTLSTSKKTKRTYHTTPAAAATCKNIKL